MKDSLMARSTVALLYLYDVHFMMVVTIFIIETNEVLFVKINGLFYDKFYCYFTLSI